MVSTSCFSVGTQSSGDRLGDSRATLIIITQTTWGDRPHLDSNLTTQVAEAEKTKSFKDQNFKDCFHLPICLFLDQAFQAPILAMVSTTITLRDNITKDAALVPAPAAAASGLGWEREECWDICSVDRGW